MPQNPVTELKIQLAEDTVVDICQKLIQIDTSNFGDDSGPGERQAAEYVSELLSDVGLEVESYEPKSRRTNLVTRITGSDPSLPALVLHGHLDVVPALEAQWKFPAFAGVIEDGVIWGRGAVDMKGMNAMILSVIRELLQSGYQPKRDLVLAFFADEEAGGVVGAQSLVSSHPQFFEGASEAISEVGGYSVELNGRRAYLLQTAEKGIAWLRLLAQGKAGHGSQITSENVVTELSGALWRIGQYQWPTQIIPTVDKLLRGISELTALPYDAQNPETVSQLIDALGSTKKFVGATLQNTTNPTAINSGFKVNVIPENGSAMVDVRFLPGQRSQVLQTLQELAGPRIVIDPMIVEEAIEAPFSGNLVDAMVNSLQKHDPDAVVLPYALSAGTDNKALARLGIKGYGFAPLQLPNDLDFPALFHGVNERVPVASLKFGAKVLRDLLLQV